MTSTYEEEFDFSGSVGADVAKEANKGGDFQREIEFLTLKADEASVAQGKDRAIIRLCTEYERKDWMGDPATTPMTRWSLPWITVKQHYAPTRQRPPFAREGSTWPAKMFAVCRCDKVFSKKYGGVCLVCQQGNKASDRTWALAIEREQVVENGRIVGIRDKMREVFDRDESGEPIVLSTDSEGKKTYQMKTVPAWTVLNFGWKNFFNPLSGQASYFKTILGRDYIVQRTGMGNNDTTYTFVGLDPITITGEWAQSLGVAEGTPYDLGLVVAEHEGRNIPLGELLYPDMPDLRKIVAERTSPDYFGRWFDPNWLPEGYVPGQQANGAQQGVQSGQQAGYQPPAGQPSQPATPVTPEPAAPAANGEAPASGPGPSALDALKARVTGASQ